MNLLWKVFSKEKKKEKDLLNKLKRTIVINKNDIVSRRTLGDLYLKTNNKTEAIEQFLWIADNYRKDSFYNKSIAMYKRIVKINPENDQYLFDLADVYVKNKMKTEALLIYRIFIDKSKKEKKSDTLIELLNKVILIDKNKIDFRIEMAGELLKCGDKKHAITEYLFIVKKLFATKRFEEAEKLLINTGIKDNRLFGKLLICYIKQNKLTKGLDLIKKQTLENSNNIEVFGSIIDLYIKKKLIKYALRVNKKISKKDPEATNMFLKIAVYYLMLKKYDEAYNYLLPLLNKNISLENFNGAIDMLNVFLNYNDDFIPALKKLSSIYKKKKDTSALIKHYERLIPLYKKKNLINDLKKILKELVEISDTPFTYKHQLTEISEEQELYTSDDELNDEKEFLAYNNRLLDECLLMSDYNNAIKISDKIITEYPDLIEPKVNLMLVLEKAGNLNKALEIAKNTISILISEKNKLRSNDLTNNVNNEITDDGKNPEDDAIDFEVSDIDMEELIIDLSDDDDKDDEVWETGKIEPIVIKNSFQKQRSFEKITSKKSDMQKMLAELSSSIGDVLAENKRSCRSVCLKLVNTDSKTISKTITKENSIFKGADILLCSKGLLKEIKTEMKKFKSLSISVSKLEEIEG